MLTFHWRGFVLEHLKREDGEDYGRPKDAEVHDRQPGYAGETVCR
jgi:hypothetical protein